MPNGKVHKVVGTGVGACYAAIHAGGQSARNRAIETLGGGLGGYVGGPFPDVLEPALSPRHRGIAHSCSVGAAICFVKSNLDELVAACRERADKAAALSGTVQDGVLVTIPSDGLSQLWAQIEELFWRLLAGFLNGLAAGYVSHLALDAMTPSSLPLLS